MRAHCAPHATGLPLLPVVCLLVTMGMDMNEWLIAWIVLLKAVRAVCAPKCLEKDARADFLCLHCYPNAVGDNAGAYLGFQSHPKRIRFLFRGNPSGHTWILRDRFFP